MKKNQHYRLPLILINSYIWAGLISPAKAILPILGVYANKEGKAWPGVKLIARLAGYKNSRYREIRAGMNDLIKNKLVIRKKQGRHYNYFLSDLVIWKRGRSYFPIYKNMILGEIWANLTASEKALYVVLGLKAKVNDPDITGSVWHASGNIISFKKYYEYAGISRWSFKNAYSRLSYREIEEGQTLIEFWSDTEEREYMIYCPN